MGLGPSPHGAPASSAPAPPSEEGSPCHHHRPDQPHPTCSKQSPWSPGHLPRPEHVSAAAQGTSAWRDEAVQGPPSRPQGWTGGCPSAELRHKHLVPPG